jgi:hypothetical protein
LEVEGGKREIRGYGGKAAKMVKAAKIMIWVWMAALMSQAQVVISSKCGIVLNFGMGGRIAHVLFKLK